jgi:hypothetical protein
LIYLVAGYSCNELSRVRPTVNELARAFTGNDISGVIKIIDTLFATIPSPLWIGARESFFHGLLHNTFQLLGIDLESEAHSSNGRADIIVKTASHIYVMEFKLDGSTTDALNQVTDKGYLRPYQLDPRQKTIIGINFSSEKHQVAGWEMKEIK